MIDTVAELNRMIDAVEALRKIERWADFHSRGVLCDAEMIDAFFCTVMEAPLSASDDCLAALPTVVWPLLLEALTEFAERNYYDDRHAYIRDGMTIDQRKQYYRQMQSHSRAVGERLLQRLRGENAT